MKFGTRVQVEKLKFLVRQGIGQYKRGGRRFFQDLENYVLKARRVGRNIGEVIIDPRTDDWEPRHPLMKSVFEASYAADIVSRVRPSKVHDIGSNLVFLATLSSFVDVVVLDSRVIDFKKPGLTLRTGDARRLPFRDDECEFVTSMCVIEHIGLGRYGDPIDPLGDYAFIKEVKRCLKPGGVFVLSMPVAGRPALVFNAHRVYALEQISELTSGFTIADARFIQPGRGELPEREVAGVLSDSVHDYVVWAAILRKT